MISFTLKCENEHSFESWFQSAAAFDALRKAGHLSCAICGSSSVSKAVMAPRVTAKSNTRAPQPEQGSSAPVPMLSQPQSEMEQAVEALRRKVEETSDYVGKDFASEARAIHLGDKPERAIYGEAGAEQARALIEDGVPVLPLPFAPRKKLS